MTISRILLLLSLLISFAKCQQRSFFVPTKEHLDILRDQARILFETDPANLDPENPSVGQTPTVGSLVRLVFHDCAGVVEGAVADENDRIAMECDGCVDSDITANAGLKELAIDKVESVYIDGGWQAKGMSRADFWAAIGTNALEYAAAQNPVGDLDDHHYPPGNSVANFFFGRTDCSTSPSAPFNPNSAFIGPHNGWDKVFEFFNGEMGMTMPEVAAILGAHSLGRCHPEHSGFSGAWTINPGRFNNQYYKNLMNQNLDLDQVPMDLNPFHQWEPRSSTAPDIMALNVDVCLHWRLEEHMDLSRLDGIVTCRGAGSSRLGDAGIEVCPLEITAQRGIIQDFAENNVAFFDAFLAAWNKLIQTGNDNLVEVQANPHCYVPQGTPADPNCNTPVAPTPPPVNPVVPSPPPVNQVGDGNRCCRAIKRNFNGRCWGFEQEGKCGDLLHRSDNICYWDVNDCLNDAELQLKLRHDPCGNHGECASSYCRKTLVCR